MANPRSGAQSNSTMFFSALQKIEKQHATFLTKRSKNCSSFQGDGEGGNYNSFGEATVDCWHLAFYSIRGSRKGGRDTQRKQRWWVHSGT